MLIRRLELVDFRSYERLELSLVDGLTAIIGPNGIGKTNVVEALALLATLKSFRGAPTESLVRRGAATAVVRAVGERGGREVSIDLELGKGRTALRSINNACSVGVICLAHSESRSSLRMIWRW